MVPDGTTCGWKVVGKNADIDYINKLADEFGPQGQCGDGILAECFPPSSLGVCINQRCEMKKITDIETLDECKRDDKCIRFLSYKRNQSIYCDQVNNLREKINCFLQFKDLKTCDLQSSPAKNSVI